MKFNTENDLWNHAQNSEDHAEKFEDYWKKSVTDEKESEYYIDRAAERREAFGVNEEELKKCFQEKRSDTGPKLPIPIGDIEEHSTSDDSFGAKLMKKLGWKEGSGLGKDSSGIVEAIKAKTLENSSAGIGATRIISADEIKSKSYNDIVRSSRKKRYNE